MTTRTMKSGSTKITTYGRAKTFADGVADERHSWIQFCDRLLAKIGDNDELDREKAIVLKFRRFGKSQNKRDKARAGGR